MEKIFYIMGKSASGKDKIYRFLMENEALGLKPLILYTTRPIRAGEEEGREYYFTDEKALERMRKSGRVIEERTYQTVVGPWTYFTADDGRIDLSRHPYLGIGTPESYIKMKAYYGNEAVVPLYIEVNDFNRLSRSIKRESKKEKPNYQEVCRRFLADTEDFSEEKLSEAGIGRRFENDGDLADCLREVEEYISGML